MYREAKCRNSIFGIAWNSVLAVVIVLLVLIVVVLFIGFTAQPAHGQPLPYPATSTEPTEQVLKLGAAVFVADVVNRAEPS